MNVTQQPMFRLERKIKMKYHVKSIISGLTIVLVILIVYICTLPSVQPQEGNNLRWLQKIIDENTKKKLAMKNLYQPKIKIDQQEPSLEEDPFWFLTSTLSYSESTTGQSIEFFETTIGSSTSSQTIQTDVHELDTNKNLIQNYIKKFGLPALQRLLNQIPSTPSRTTKQVPKYNFHLNLKEAINNINKETAATETIIMTSTEANEYDYVNENRNENAVPDIHLKQTDIALTIKLENDKDKMKETDTVSESHDSEPHKVIVKVSQLGTIYENNSQTVMNSKQDTRENLNTVDKNGNNKDTAYKAGSTNSEQSVKLNSDPFQRNFEPLTSSVFKNDMNNKNGVVDPQKEPAETIEETVSRQSFPEKLPVLSKMTEATNGLGVNKQTNKTTAYKLSDNFWNKTNNLPANDNKKDLNTLTNNDQAGKDIMINKPLIKVNIDAGPKHEIDTISINSENDDKSIIQKQAGITETPNNTQAHETMSMPQSNGLIQNVSVIRNSRVKICELDTSVSSESCVPSTTITHLQTLTPFVKLCTYPINEDSGVSRSLHEKGSWEFRMAQDLQLAMLKDKSTGLIDVGAGIGVYSIAAASLKRPVIAIEPYMPHVRLLQKSILLNRLQKYISLVCNAVSNLHEILRAEHVPGNKTQVQWNYVPNMIGRRTEESDENVVATITLDDLLEVINLTSAVVKIDVPKYDLKILKSSHMLFHRVNIPYVFMHWSGRNHMELYGIAQFFLDQNYRAFDRLHGKEVEVQGIIHSDTQNVVWVKQKPKIKHLFFLGKSLR